MNQKEYRKQYYSKNKEKIAGYMKKYREKNKEKFAEHMKKYREKNREKFIEYNKEYSQKKRTWLESYKKNLKCESCGETHPAVLDFHHKNPFTKEMSIGLALSAHSVERILSEIVKCSVLCSNCHRKLHWKQRQENKEHDALFKKYSLEFGEEYAVALLGEVVISDNNGQQGPVPPF
jgi:hypothetical protein